MKIFRLLLISAVLIAGLNSCQDKFTESYHANVPVYMSLVEWRALDISAESPKPIIEAGKIYIYQDYLFIVDRGLGVHIVNNASPASPQSIAFLPVLGSSDVAVRNNTLYIDSYRDLLSFDISDPASPELSCRIPDAFDSNHGSFMHGFSPGLPVIGMNSSEGIIVGWTQKEIVRDSEHHHRGDNNFTFESIATAMGDAANNVSSGIGGSMAQFTVTGSYLYVLRPSSITSFDVAGALCPEQSSVTQVGWQAETIFPYNNHLFLGTTSGMMIFNLNNPASPQFVSEIAHVTACDPVVVQGDRAYVTIRSGNACIGTVNQLIVVDISNYSSPTTLAEYNLHNPHGLGIDGNTLFICDGSAGLKVFDAEDDMAITDHMIAHYENVNTFDVIPFNNVLIMSAEEGIYQYDYSDPMNILQLSLIPTN